MLGSNCKLVFPISERQEHRPPTEFILYFKGRHINSVVMLVITSKQGYDDPFHLSFSPGLHTNHKFIIKNKNIFLLCCFVPSIFK